VIKSHSSYVEKYSKPQPLTDTTYYKQKGYKIGDEGEFKQSFSTNAHLDGATPRGTGAFKLVHKFGKYDKNKGFTRDMIDIGFGPRKHVYAVCRIAVGPICDNEDIIRRSLATKNDLVLYYKNTFQQFIVKEEVKSYVKKNQPLLIFTDTIYYIDFQYDQFNDFDDNTVVGIGLAHQYRKDGDLQLGTRPFGTIKKVENQIVMKVDGNNQEYKHKDVLHDLGDNNCMVLVAKQNDQNKRILLYRYDTVDFGASHYVSFILIKTSKDINSCIAYVLPNDTTEVEIIGSGESENKMVIVNGVTRYCQIALNYLTQARSAALQLEKLSTKNLIQSLMKRKLQLPLTHLQMIASAVVQEIKFIESLGEEDN
jgi:hypothetical protein